jgi:hypothetical protein
MARPHSCRAYIDMTRRRRPRWRFRGRHSEGWIVAEISLEELWRTVDWIKVGTKGYALLLDEDGYLVAHGNPNDKPLIAKQEGHQRRTRLDARKHSRHPTPQSSSTRAAKLLAVGAPSTTSLDGHRRATDRRRVSLVSRS